MVWSEPGEFGDVVRDKNERFAITPLSHSTTRGAQWLGLHRSRESMQAPYYTKVCRAASHHIIFVLHITHSPKIGRRLFAANESGPRAPRCSEGRRISILPSRAIRSNFDHPSYPRANKA